MYSHGQVRVLECLSESQMLRKPSRCSSRGISPRHRQCIGIQFPWCQMQQTHCDVNIIRCRKTAHHQMHKDSYHDMSSDDNHTSWLWSNHIYKMKEKQKKRRKPEHCWSGQGVWTPKEAITGAVGAYHAIECMSQHGSHADLSYLPSVWHNPRHVGPTDLLLRMSLHAECELSLPWLLHYVLVHLPFWAVLFVWC